jgi:hypothetical protein
MIDGLLPVQKTPLVDGLFAEQLLLEKRFLSVKRLLLDCFLMTGETGFLAEGKFLLACCVTVVEDTLLNKALRLMAGLLLA